MKVHQGHKLLLIDNEEALKRENITIESLTKNLDENNQKTINLKNTIENEINKINNLFDKVNKEVTKSYELKHEKLIKEEEELKDKLKNKVTKIKEKLENFLYESNQIIKLNEKINKGIKLFEKVEDKNIIKTLSYLSKINQNLKKKSILYDELMKNLNISFKEGENNIKYEEYFFNGIQIPKDIEIKEITCISFKLFWKIDDIKILNVDNKQIKYKVEIRKDKENEIFNKVYEGNNPNCLIDKLEENTNYEVRICSIFNNISGRYGSIQKEKNKLC